MITFDTRVSGPPRKPPVDRPVRLGSGGSDSEKSDRKWPTNPALERSVTGYDPSNMELLRNAARSINAQVAELQKANGNPKPEPRPDFADDIDQMVAAMVKAGDVVLDRETGEYRGNGYRCFRFGEV